MTTTDPDKSMRMRRASYISWANTTDRSSRTAAAREASHYGRFIAQARRDNPAATDTEIQQIADALKKAHYTDLARRSAQARRGKSQARKAEQKARIAAEMAAEMAAETKAADDAA
jgi:hypothetical protein